MISNSLWHSYLYFSKILLGMVDIKFTISRIKRQNKSMFSYCQGKSGKEKENAHFG